MHSPRCLLICQAKGDSAASNHYWRKRDMTVLHTIHEEPGSPISLPNGDTINDNKVGYLPIPALSQEGQKTRILDDLHSASLISLGQLADDGCTTQLDKDKLVVKKDGKVILTGTRNHQDNLYDIPIEKTSIQEGNFIMPTTYPLQQSSNRVNHTTCFPIPSHSASTPKVHKRPYNIDHISNTTLQSTINKF